MNHSTAMSEPGSYQDALGKLDRASRVKRGLTRDDLLQGNAIAELHRDVVGTVELAAVVDAHHVRVLESGRCGGLATKALHELVVLGKTPVEQLERDVTT